MPFALGTAEHLEVASGPRIADNGPEPARRIEMANKDQSQKKNKLNKPKLSTKEKKQKKAEKRLAKENQQ